MITPHNVLSRKKIGLWGKFHSKWKSKGMCNNLLLTLDKSKSEFNASQFIVRCRFSIECSSCFVASYHQIVEDTKVWDIYSDALHVITIGQKGTSTFLAFREEWTESLSIVHKCLTNIIFTKKRNWTYKYYSKCNTR